MRHTPASRIFYHDKDLYLNNPFLFKEVKLSSFGLGFASSHMLTSCYVCPTRHLDPYVLGDSLLQRQLRGVICRFYIAGTDLQQ